METNIESLHRYLQELQDVIIGKKNEDKRKAPMDQEASPSYSPPPLKVRVAPTTREGETLGGEGRKGDNTEGRRDAPYRRLDHLVFNSDDALKWIFRCERYFDVTI